MRGNERLYSIRVFGLSSAEQSVIEMCTGRWTAGIPRNPRVFRGCGYECCGNTAGMDVTIAGFPLGWILLRREPRIEPFT